VLSATTVDYLAFFNNKDESVCTEFCRVATNFLKQGINAKLYSTAAAKMGVDADVVKHAVEAIMTVLTEGAKIKAKESDVRDSLANTLLSAELVEAIVAAYVETASEIRRSLDETSTSDLVPEYKSLDWRLEIEVASRAARQINRPVVTLNLTTTSTSDDQSTGESGQAKVEEHLLQTDASTLVQITQELENALKEIKTREYRKLASQLSK